MSTRIAFFIAGFGIAAWAPLVPYAKARAQLNEGTLGLLLLCLGVGSIIAMPMAGALASRFGCRRVLSAGTLLLCVALPMLATVSSIPLLMAGLFLFGAGLGTVDSTVNLQAVIVERASGKTMMSGFHGLFSLGGIVGAAGVSALLGLGLSPLSATLVVIVITLGALLKAAPHLLPYGSESSGPAFAIPHGVVLFIGCLCFIVFLAEGAVLDWSAVFLSDERGLDEAYAGLGYAAFALTMTLGRLTGDAIVRRLGAKRVIVIGGLLATAGMLLATLLPAWETALLGYALVGAGCSNIVPVLYTAVGKQTVMPEHIAVPAITTLGYAGILAGPALIGFIAHGSSLSVAFVLIAVLLLAVAISGKILRV
jgi:MFS family permease